jgi:hypothetical protein
VNFPTTAALLCTLTDDQSSQNNQFSRVPWQSNYVSTHHAYKFFVPGISFKILVGAGIPSDIKRIATAPAGFVFVAEDIDKMNLRGMIKASPRPHVVESSQSCGLIAGLKTGVFARAAIPCRHKPHSSARVLDRRADSVTPGHCTRMTRSRAAFCSLICLVTS